MKQTGAYQRMTDEALIGRQREGDAAVTDFLMEKYKGMVRNKARSMYILGGDTEDLIQEGMIGLFKAVRDFDFGRDVSFRTFAELCVTRQMYSAIETANRKKNIPLNNYISLYERVSTEDSGVSVTLGDTLPTEEESTPEEMVIAKEEQTLLRDTIDTILSDFERRAMDLWLTGRTGAEIAGILGRDEKSTDNALTRAKSKLKKHLTKFS